MKKLLAFAALFAVVALTSCKYDDDDLWNSVHGLENRVAKLEELCKQMNTNISSLQTIVTALQNNVYVTGTTPLMKDGKEIGYTITFSKGNPITIYHGKDGQDGEDGITPTISVKKDTDGVYYWTLNGEFIVVDGGKIQAEGKDGTNGTTPQFKIENDYWFVSYDNGVNWTQLGKATGEDGKDADSIIITQDENNVYFELADGTVITISKTGQSTPNIIEFKDPYVKTICVAAWDTDGDSELSYVEATAITTLGTKFKGNTLIESFEELKYFTHLTSIDDDTFNACTALTSIQIPASVETIGLRAFKSCSSLANITFEKGSILRDIKGGSKMASDYMSIDYYGAFSDCSALTAIEIPASVESIGVAAFSDCKRLASVTFEHSSKLKSIGGGWSSPYGGFSYGAFLYCSSLTSIKIPASVETIGASAFKGCIKLTTVTFEKESRLTTIEGYYDYGYKAAHGTFTNCFALTTIELPASIKTIETYSFSGCGKLANIYSRSTTPPTLEATLPSEAKIYVPIGSENAYKIANEWRNYADNIIGYDFNE